jgi:hypothetical protein
MSAAVAFLLGAVVGGGWVGWMYHRHVVEVERNLRRAARYRHPSRNP